LLIYVGWKDKNKRIKNFATKRSFTPLLSFTFALVEIPFTWLRSAGLDYEGMFRNRKFF